MVSKLYANTTVQAGIGIESPPLSDVFTVSLLMSLQTPEAVYFADVTNRHIMPIWCFIVELLHINADFRSAC